MSSPVSAMALPSPLPSSSSSSSTPVERSSSISGPAVLVEGMLLSGDALLEYAQQKGLCTKCLQHTTHTRARKRLGMLRYTSEWIPVTSTDEKEGNYTVYKGYCLQPTCWTLEQVQILLGERPMLKSSSKGRNIAGQHGNRTPTRSRENSLGLSSDENQTSFRNNSTSGTSSHSNSNGERSPSGHARRSPRPRHPVADLLNNRESQQQQQQHPSTPNSSKSSRSKGRSGERSDRHKEHEPATTASPTASTASSTQDDDRQSRSSSSRPTVKAQASDSSIDHLHYQHPRRRQPTSNSTSASSLSFDDPQGPPGSQSQSQPNTTTTATTRKVVRKKKAVPDLYVLQQLNKIVLAAAATAAATYKYQGSSSASSNSNSANASATASAAAAASDAELWTTLYTRYGKHADLYTIDSRNGKIMTLLQLLKVTEDADCYEPSWILLHHLTKPQTTPSLRRKAEPNEPPIEGFVRKILVGISTEFDRESFLTSGNQSNSMLSTASGSGAGGGNGSSNAKKLAALTLYNMLKAEEHSFDSHFLGALQAMSRARRQRWIAVLLDTLMFQDEEQLDETSPTAASTNSTVDEMAGKTEILYVVWNLLVSQPASDRDHEEYEGEEGLLMQTIVGIIVSILSSECDVAAGSVGDVTNASTVANANNATSSVHLSETALGLLATVVSRGGVMALSGRHFECLSIICDTMKRHQNEAIHKHEVFLQGANATCHIVTHFVLQRDHVDVWNEGNEANVSGNGNDAVVTRFVEQLVHVVQLTLQYEKEQNYHPGTTSPEFSAATCRLLTVLLDADPDVLRLVVDTDFMQGPSIVETLLRMLDSGTNGTNDIGVVESASDILVFLMEKVAITMTYVRQTENIAALMIRWINSYETSPFVQQQMCLIIEHIVETEDPTFGRDIGQAGGLSVMGDFLLVSAAREGPLIEIAARVLVGILASVDSATLETEQVFLMEAVVTSLTNNLRILALQMALLEVVHCLCLRDDCLAGNFGMVLSVVVESMDHHLGSPHLLAKGCSVLRRVSLMTDNWSVAVQTGAAKMITDALMIHPTFTEFVMEAMATLKDLASNGSFRDGLDLVEAETAVVSLFAANKDHADFCSLAFATLNNLAVDPRSRVVSPMKTYALNAILEALDLFATTDSEVARNACLLLKSYTYDASNLVMIRQASEDLLPILDHLRTNASGETQERAQYIMGKL